MKPKVKAMVEKAARRGTNPDVIVKRAAKMAKLSRDNLDAIWLYAWSLQERLGDGLDRLPKGR